MIKDNVWRIVPTTIRPSIGEIGHFVSLLSKFKHGKLLNHVMYYQSRYKKEKIGFVPPIFNIWVSGKCNLRCPTCYYISQNPRSFDHGDFIDINKFELVINKYAPFIENVLLSGGEPLLHPKLDVLIKIVKKNGLLLHVSTNGILIKRMIKLMKSLDYINISLDGYNYETYKHFRGGTKEQFEDILSGLRLLRDNEIKFDISFLLTEENFDQIYEMIEFAYNIKPNRIVFHNYNPHGTQNFRPIIKGKEVDNILYKIISVVDYPFDILLPVIFNTNSKSFNVFKCDLPWSSCLFNDKFDISYCNHLLHDKAIGNLMENYDFNSQQMERFRRLIINNQCPLIDCLYCHHRFIGKEYGYFNSRINKWFLNQ